MSLSSVVSSRVSPLFLRLLPVRKLQTLRWQVSEYRQLLFWMVGDICSQVRWRGLRIVVSGALHLASKFAAMGVMYYFIDIIENDRQVSVLGVALPGPDSPGLLTMGVAGMLACLVISAIFKFETRRQSLRVGRQYDEFCGRRIFVQTSRLPHPESQWAESQVTSGQVNSYQGTARICGRAASELCVALPALVGFLLALVVLIVIDPELTATISLLGVLIVLALYPVNRQAAKVSIILEDNKRDCNRKFKSVMTGLRQASVPLSMNGPVLNRTFEADSVRAMLDGASRRRRMTAEAGLVSQLGSSLILAVILLIMGTGLIEETRSWSESVVYLAALRFMLRDFANTAKAPISINRFYAQINQLFLFDRSASKAQNAAVDHSIEPFDQVQFDIPRYDEGAEPLFAKAGSVLAFVGPRKTRSTAGGILLAAQIAPPKGLRELPIQIDTMLLDPELPLRVNLGLPDGLSASDVEATLGAFAPEGATLDWAKPGWLDHEPEEPWDTVLPIWAIYALQALAALQRGHRLILIKANVFEGLGARWSGALKTHLKDGVLILICRRIKQVGSRGETAVIVSDGQAARAWIEWDGSDKSRGLLDSAYDKFAEDQFGLPGVPEDDLVDADEEEDDESLL